MHVSCSGFGSYVAEYQFLFCFIFFPQTFINIVPVEDTSMTVV